MSKDLQRSNFKVRIARTVVITQKRLQVCDLEVQVDRQGDDEEASYREIGAAQDIALVSAKYTASPWRDDMYPDGGTETTYEYEHVNSMPERIA